MGGVGVLLCAGFAAAQGIPLVWEKREFIAGVNGPDAGVDTGVFNNPDLGIKYAFITGWMKTPAGGFAIATIRYNPDNPNDANRIVRTLPDPAGPVTLEFRAAAMAIDSQGDLNSPGYVYVTGEAQNPDGTFDFLSLKYDLALQLVGSWGSGGINRFSNPNHTGDDRAVDVTITGDLTDRRVVVTGTSDGGVGHGHDIYTIAYRADNGSIAWSDAYNGPASGPDSAAELGTIRIDQQSGLAGEVVVVCGTSLGVGTGFDIATICYTSSGARAIAWPQQMPGPGWGPGVRRYNGPANGHDLCTLLAAATPADTQSVVDRVVVGGRTPHVPIGLLDDDYVFVSYRVSNGDPFWLDDGTHGPGARTWDPGSADYSDDGATDADVRFRDNAITLWATGSARRGPSSYGVGTIGLDLTANSGATVGTHIYEVVDPIEQHGVAISAPPLEGAKVFATGWQYDPDSDPQFRFLTLEYNGLAPLALTRGAIWGGVGLENKARAMFFEPSILNALFVTGHSGAHASGLDLETLRYNP